MLNLPIDEVCKFVLKSANVVIRERMSQRFQTLAKRKKESCKRGLITILYVHVHFLVI